MIIQEVRAAVRCRASSPRCTLTAGLGRPSTRSSRCPSDGKHLSHIVTVSVNTGRADPPISVATGERVEPFLVRAELADRALRSRSLTRTDSCCVDARAACDSSGSCRTEPKDGAARHERFLIWPVHVLSRAHTGWCWGAGAFLRNAGPRTAAQMPSPDVGQVVRPLSFSARWR